MRVASIHNNSFRISENMHMYIQKLEMQEPEDSVLRFAYLLQSTVFAQYLSTVKSITKVFRFPGVPNSCRLLNPLSYLQCLSNILLFLIKPLNLCTLYIFHGSYSYCTVTVRLGNKQSKQILVLC